MNKIDLHMHSVYSDGELTPIELLERCNKLGIEVMAITDHNNVLGVKETIKNNPYQNVKVIPGIELEGKYTNGQLHILGYNISLEDKGLNEICRLIMEDNVRRLKSLINNLKNIYGLSFKEEDLQTIFEQIGNVGRPDIAKLCIKYGYTKTIKETFDKLLNPIKDKTIKKTIDLTDKECIECIIKAGGTVSLAHPITLKKDIGDLKEYIKLLKSYGLTSIEVYHSLHSKEYSCELLKIADEVNLLVSAGSDYHGPIVKPNVRIGEYNQENVGFKEITILSKIMR